jgi:multiple sugar transport system substrate-binding protein
VQNFLIKIILRADPGSKQWLRLLPALALLLLLAACRPAVLNPPRHAAQESVQQAATVEVYVSAAPTATPQSVTEIALAEDTAVSRPSITVWVNETSTRHAQILEQMSAEFGQQFNIHVEIILVSPRLLPDLIATAAASGTLPDLVLHPIEYTLGWAERGILDVATAGEIVNRLGRHTFDPHALEMAAVTGQVDGTGQPLVAAVPSDGWKQLLIYRADWFEQAGLAPPNSFETMLLAADTFFQPDTLTSGLVIPTESSLVSTQQVFEQLALANGCRLIDDAGEVTILHPACLDVLDFYRDLVNSYSPSDVQTDGSALNAYLAGRTAFIITSPRTLVPLAGLDPDAPATCVGCLTADHLAQQSGFVTAIGGRSDFATEAEFADLTYLGITGTADKEAAAAFVAYWLGEGYLDWLAIAPEHKVPLRWGTSEQPTLFLDAWGDIPLVEDGPSLRQAYGDEMVSRLSRDLGSGRRWGFHEGQGALMTVLYEKVIFSIVLQEMLSGYFSSSQAVVEAHKRVVALIPGYDYEVDLDE